jgi:Xaa-Pro aminopeptidase
MARDLVAGTVDVAKEELRVRAEAVGARYDRARMCEARDRTRTAIREIAAGIAPGMAEEEGMELARRILRDAGMLRSWHAIHVRFGTNTLKRFGEPSERGVVLKDDDIFFIDIGPIWQHWEGDGGDTFVVGQDPEMRRIARDVRAVFDAVQYRWQVEGLTGVDLYKCAIDEAEARGWQLNLAMPGHRLSDFPHAVHHKGDLAAAPFTPSPGLWMLEIQIRHPNLPFSAFYEDLLLEPLRT